MFDKQLHPRGIIVHIEYQSVRPFVGIGSSHPLPRKRVRVCLSPGPKGGEQHTLAGEGWGDPIRTTGQKAWHSVYSVSCTHLVTMATTRSMRPTIRRRPCTSHSTMLEGNPPHCKNAKKICLSQYTVKWKNGDLTSSGQFNNFYFTTYNLDYWNKSKERRSRLLLSLEYLRSIPLSKALCLSWSFLSYNGRYRLF
jgi:hypothetical protein